MQKLVIALMLSRAAAAKTGGDQCVPGDLLQMRCEGTATYQVKFTGQWTAEMFPVDYPENAHWSPLVGATHKTYDAFWYRKGLATPGVQEVAETGNPQTLIEELDNDMYLSSARAAGPVFQRDGPPIRSSAAATRSAASSATSPPRRSPASRSSKSW